MLDDKLDDRLEWGGVGRESGLGPNEGALDILHVC